MDHVMTTSEQKLAEKLIILNDHGQGMITRIYNIKKACSDPKSRPAFLNDKNLEPALKVIVKKFPSIENSKAVHMQPVMQIHVNIIKGLSNYYYTFVDIMTFRDHVSELLTQIDASFVHFDITLNFELTKAYFDLMTTYASIFLLMSKVEDRKAVLSLFNHAIEMQKTQSEPNFPRLGQMILDYENPFRKFVEEFTPHAQRIGIGLNTVCLLYKRRNMSGEVMRQTQLLSLTTSPQQMLSPINTETVPCEFLSLEEMTRWILFSCTLCPSQITAQPNVVDAWKSCLQDGFCLTLYRDEVIYIHKDIQTLFESLKGYSKRGKEVQEYLTSSMQFSPAFHRERRKYLLTAFDEMILIFRDQPGLFGPKLLVALTALSHARDEIQWLVKHKHHPPPKGKKVALDDYDDSMLSKLMFDIMELRGLFSKYSHVIKRYFMQYLSGFDVAVLKIIIQRISVCPEDESMIMTDFVEALSSPDIKQGDASVMPDFRGLRLDWMRLQTYTSVRGSVPELKDNKDLAMLMNTISLHTKLVDSQDSILNEVSDLSLLCFYPSLFHDSFQSCLNNVHLIRYSIAYPLVCSTFLNSTHSMCPEERHLIGDRSLVAVNSFLDAISFKATHFISQFCEEHLRLSRQLDPGNAVHYMTILEDSKLKKERPRPIPPKPGQESRKKTVENQKPVDTKYHSQIDLLLAITHCKDIHVWEHIFSPKEYLVSQLEEFFSKTIFRLLNYNEATQEIARPSALLSDIRSYITTLHRLEEFVNLDMGRIFNATLLQQTQNCDNTGGPTLTSTYTFWYNEIVLKRICLNGGVIYSPVRESFIGRTKASYPPIADYTDMTEMRALSELLGAYGVRHFSRKLVQKVILEVEELKKLVINNKDLLVSIYENPLKCDVFELVKKIKGIEDVITRTTSMGILLIFRQMLSDGLKDVLPRRVPFLMRVLSDFKSNNTRNDSTITHEMAQAAGLHFEFDAELYHLLRNSRDKMEEDGFLWTLLLVLWAIAVPILAFKDNNEYNPLFEAHENNAHCMAVALNSLPQALFTITGEDVDEKMKIFLKVATSGLLRLGVDQSNKDLVARQRSSSFVLLDLIVKKSQYLSQDEFDMYFPYDLVRDAYSQVYKKQRLHIAKRNGELSNQEQEAAS
ncbi:nck-associated protein 1 homolog isoform X3 [Hydra vulgaris]|uniref:Nck-associated protein 1 homolog isoform X2 n=1 Tax=Hydra vulgaris TaxID=6087 RepID=A0ABM4BHI6_HYDVU